MFTLHLPKPTLLQSHLIKRNPQLYGPPNSGIDSDSPGGLRQGSLEGGIKKGGGPEIKKTGTEGKDGCVGSARAVSCVDNQSKGRRRGVCVSM